MLIPKVLVVYDSRTRSTEAVALAIRNCLEIRGLRCDVEALHQPRRLAPIFRRRPVCVETRHHPEDYQVVVVGTQASPGAPSPQVASFLEDSALLVQNLAVFSITGPSSAGGDAAWIEAMTQRKAVAALALQSHDVERGAHKSLIRPFVERIEGVARSTAAAAAGSWPAPHGVAAR